MTSGGRAFRAAALKLQGLHRHRGQSGGHPRRAPALHVRRHLNPRRPPVDTRPRRGGLALGNRNPEQRGPVPGEGVHRRISGRSGGEPAPGGFRPPPAPPPPPPRRYPPPEAPPPPPPPQRGEARRDGGNQRVRFVIYLLVPPFGILVHRPNRRAGNDIVELVGEQLLPAPGKRLARVGRAEPRRRHPVRTPARSRIRSRTPNQRPPGRIRPRLRRPPGSRPLSDTSRPRTSRPRPQHGIKRLHLPQPELQHPVPPLRPRLGGVGPPVQLQIKLAVPLGKRLDLAENLPQGLGHPGPPHLRRPFQRPQPPGGFQIRPHRAASPVPLADGLHQLTVQLLMLQIVPGVMQLIHRHPAVVAMAPGGNEMGLHPRAVDPPPQEGIVGKARGIVPVDLARYEVFDLTAGENLGQRRRVAEHIRQPQGIPLVIQHTFRGLLPDEKLADQGFPVGDIAVRLDPHAAVGLPLTPLISPLDRIEHRGILPFHNLQLGRLGLNEDELLELLGQAGHIREGARRLAFGFPNRPDPGVVDMGMADQMNRRYRIPRGRGQKRRDCPPGGLRLLFEFIPRSGKVNQRERRVQGMNNPMPAQGVVIQVPRRIEEHLGIVVERVDLPGLHHQFGPPEPIGIVGNGGPDGEEHRFVLHRPHTRKAVSAVALQMNCELLSAFC